MKAFVSSAAAAALAFAIPTAAHSSSFTLGGPLAVHCYTAALERDTSRPAMEACERSLDQEPLTASDRAAYADLTRAQSLEPGWDMPAKELARYSRR